MIIDGHAHACGEFGDPKKLIEILDKFGVDKVVLCPGSSNDTTKPRIPKVKPSRFVTNPKVLFLSNWLLRLTHKRVKNRNIGNEFVFSFVEKYPDRILQFYWVNPKDSNYLKKLGKALDKCKIKGIKLHQCVVPFTNDSLEMQEIATFAATNQLPIFIHVFSSKEANKLIKLARKNPETNFILAHLMGLENAVKYGKDLKNLYFDISPYYIISEKRILYGIENFGADHILLGSDSPLGEDNLKNNIEKIRRMALPEEQKNQILGINIAKLLRLL